MLTIFVLSFSCDAEVTALVVTKCIKNDTKMDHAVDRVIHCSHKRYIELTLTNAFSWELGRKDLMYISHSKDRLRSTSGSYRITNSKCRIKGVTYNLKNKKDIAKLMNILDHYK